MEHNFAQFSYHLAQFAEHSGGCCFEPHNWRSNSEMPTIPIFAELFRFSRPISALRFWTLKFRKITILQEKSVPDQIKDVTLTYTPLLRTFYVAVDNYTWTTVVNIPDKKRNAPLRTDQLSGRSQVIGQLSLYQGKGMSCTAESHVFCNLASKLC